MTKQVHAERQGSEEWLSLRMTKRPSSLVAAVLGLSPYITRNEVLKIYATGIPAEIDSFVEKFVFAEGHRVEPLAREIIEVTIREGLSPVVYSKGLLSASTDGINFAETIGFECKQWNDDLAKLVIDGIVPDSHMPQVQQCLLVTGAEEWYFTVSDGTVEKTVYTIVKPSKEWFDRICAAWDQFEIDLANYNPVIHAEKALPDAAKELPALFVHAYGEITTNNMQDYGKALSDRLKEARDIILVDDKDFANANKNSKDFRSQIEKLKAVKAAMLEQTTSIGEAARMIDDWCEDLRVTALQLEKDVKREDAAKKEVIVGGAKNAYEAYLIELAKEFSPLHLNVVKPNFADAIAKKRDYNSMQNAVDTMLANAKIAADAVAKDIRAKLHIFKEYCAGYEFLFNDLQSIIYKEDSDFYLIASTRVEKHKKSEAEKLEAEREKIRLEEEAKAKTKAEKEIILIEKTKLISEKANQLVKPISELELIDEGFNSAKEKEQADQTPVVISKAKQGDQDTITHVTLGDVANVAISEKLNPTRAGLTKTVAFGYGVGIELAEKWLVEAFSQEKEAA